MILSKQSILTAIASGEIKIDPFEESMLKEASYSFTLAGDLTLQPGAFTIAVTNEKLTLPPEIACILSTRRSIAEQGIDALQTDYFCEPGTDNLITLDLKNHGSAPVTIKTGVPIVKGVFIRVQ